MANHDGSYKYFFSHARMVEDLLRGFVKEKWVEDLDFTTLEKMNGSYVSDDLRERADDVIWRIRWGKDWLYVYILLEFQSTVDPWMAVRIITEQRGQANYACCMLLLYVWLWKCFYAA